MRESTFLGSSWLMAFAIDRQRLEASIDAYGRVQSNPQNHLLALVPRLPGLAPPRGHELGSYPEFKGSIGEGPSHSNFSDQSSVRILGIRRKQRKAISSKYSVRIREI